jgi:hypothetical protein
MAPRDNLDCARREVAHALSGAGLFGSDAALPHLPRAESGSHCAGQFFCPPYALPLLFHHDQRIKRKHAGAAFEHDQRVDLDLGDFRPRAHQGSDPPNDID